MDIDPRIASTIVENIKGALSHDINFFDTNGHIIASTDPARVDTDHEAARLAARTGQSVAVDAEHPFAGARDGINVPVMQGDAVIAVIGITGERAEVEPFGNVIKKMTEILVRENLEQVSRFDRRMMAANLTNLLIAPQPDTGLIDYLTDTLNVDLTAPRVVAVGRLHIPEGIRNDIVRRIGTTQDGTYDIVDRLMAGQAQSLYSIYGGEFRLVLTKDDSQTGSDDHDGRTEVLERISQEVSKTTGLPLVFGISAPVHSVNDYREAYLQARSAELWLAFLNQQSEQPTKQKHTLDYDDADLGMALCAIRDDIADRFSNHILSGLTEEEKDEAAILFDAYTRHNGSIRHTAEELFLHKNTVQNRLNKITRATGYNPRDLSDYTLLALAFALRRLLKFWWTTP
ncbi:putative sugar diacid recognition [Bifidobacterium saguini DSM 23967]|uniref:Helix-turn-helix domain-containing protein n=2 Tax=Bifidobacterium saguini TaxID=762210 RepID=A0ABX7S9K1_9BIFI|nr:sugar diacid recognition domain-containing protein [Bifidobacterium saguini]KFI92108.1 putative sugar diacid recognition [Bifidobacterium saguini DSM 23967]QTB90112.1 helix-turn-helix domain-containing protein [Bifidobacterium saguini]